MATQAYQRLRARARAKISPSLVVSICLVILTMIAVGFTIQIVIFQVATHIRRNESAERFAQHSFELLDSLRKQNEEKIVELIRKFPDARQELRPKLEEIRKERQERRAAFDARK